MSNERIALRLHVQGRVQGVAYRAWTARKAAGLGVAGWVRNETDGSVTAHLEGPAQAVEELVAAMKRGPRLARVTSCDTQPATPVGSSGFHIAG